MKPLYALFFALLALPAAAQYPVSSWTKISQTQGNLGQTLVNQEFWGLDPVDIGDLDGDGVTDIAVGWPLNSIGGANRGSVLVLLRNADGSVKSSVRIGSSSGGFTGTLDDGDQFGSAVSAIGDLNQDGIEDIAVGAFADDDGGYNYGAVWLIFLNTDGTAKGYYKISDTTGGLGAPFGFQENFGTGLTSLGDQNGDGFLELAVGARGDRDGTGMNNAAKGAVFILHLHSIGRVVAWNKISLTSGGFVGPLGDSDNFGTDVEPLGDLDGDGIQDIAVGASSTDDGGGARGAVWILLLNADYTVKAETKISDITGGLQTSLTDGALFGCNLANIGDQTGNGRDELAVGALGFEGIAGAVFLLELSPSGTVTDEWLISPSQGNTPPDVSGSDQFGSSLSLSSDIDGDGLVDLLVSAPGDDDGGSNRGAIYSLSVCSLIRASSTNRPLSGGVKGLFSEISPAIVGSSWQTTIDLTVFGAAWTAVVVSSTSSRLPIPTAYGELLILPPFFPAHVVFLGSHLIAIPNDCGLIGARIYSQAALVPIDGRPIQLTNGLNIIMGGS